MLGLFGVSKSGKSEFSTRATGPLYIAHLDPQDNLDAHLAARKAAGFEGVVYEPLRIPTLPYALLTEDEAKRRVELVEGFIRDAINQSWQDDKDGKYPGLFVIDGGVRLKGYIEKWKLGESSTLGYRAEAGGHGPSQIEYAATNAYLADLVSRFSGTPLNFIITFQGKEEWRQYFEDGKRVRRPSGKIVTSMPGSVLWALNANIEAFVEMQDVVSNNVKVGSQPMHKLRFDLMGVPGMDYLRERVMPAMSFDQLRDLLNSNLPAEEVLEPPHEIERVDTTEPLDGGEE